MYIAHALMAEEKVNQNNAFYHQRLDELIAIANSLICDNIKNLQLPETDRSYGQQDHGKGEVNILYYIFLTINK